MNKVIIDNTKCVSCFECINVCRNEVLGMTGGVVKVVKPTQCLNCEDCCDICETSAIKVIYDSKM